MSTKHVIQADIKGDRGLAISSVDESIQVKTDNTSVFINSQGALSSYVISQSFINKGKNIVVSEFALSEGLATREPAIAKKTGFNLNKTDSYTSSDSDTLATSKALSDGLQRREPSINKKTGFNLDKSDSYTTDSTNSLATSKAVFDGLKTKEPTIAKKTGFNLNKSDSTDSNDSNVLATAKAVYDAKRSFNGVTDIRFGSMARFRRGENHDDNTVQEIGNGYLVTSATYSEKNNFCQMTARQLQINKGGTWYTVAY